MASIAISTFASELKACGQDMFQSSATQVHQLGSRFRTRDGRVYFYAQAGAVDTVAGSLYQSAVPLPNHLASTSPVVAIGATQFQFTPGATAGASNLYAEGYLGVDTTPGNGFTYLVAGHPAITSSVAFTLTLFEGIVVALTAASRLGLVTNAYKNIVVTPIVSTGEVVGVAPYVITTVQYGWVQTWGPASVLVNGAPAVTAPVVNSAATSGAVDAWTAAAQPTATLVGNMMQVGVTTKNNFVFLRLQA